jgi:hypothetical protein
MTGKPDGAAGLLAGLAERLAAGLLEEVEYLASLPQPDTDIALERRVRLRGVIARTALSIHKLQAQEDVPGAPQDQDEADMDDQPDDPETVERKYVELQKFLDRLADRAGARGDAGDSSASRTGHPPRELAPSCQRGPATADGPLANVAAPWGPGVGEDLGRGRLAG